MKEELMRLVGEMDRALVGKQGALIILDYAGVGYSDMKVGWDDFNPKNVKVMGSVWYTGESVINEMRQARQEAVEKREIVYYIVPEGSYPERVVREADAVISATGLIGKLRDNVRSYLISLVVTSQIRRFDTRLAMALREAPMPKWWKYRK